MADIGSMLSNMPTTYVNGVNVPTPSPQASPDMSGLAQVLSSIIPGTTPDMLSSIFGAMGSPAQPATMSAAPQAGGSGVSGGANAGAPIAPASSPAPSPSPAPASAPPAPSAPPPPQGISQPLPAHAMSGPGPMPPGASSLPPPIDPSASAPPAGAGGPGAAPTPPTMPAHNYSPLAKALMVLASLSGGGQAVQGFVQGQQAHDQQQFANAQQVYNNQVAAQATQHAQVVAQLKAHDDLFDAMGSMDPASQQAYLNSLSPAQLQAYGVNKSAFYDAQGNFIPVTAADKQDTASAIVRAQTAAKTGLANMTTDAQQSLHDNMDPDTFESTYGVKWQGFTPFQTVKGVNDTTRTATGAGRALSYEAYQAAQTEYRKALTSAIPQNIDIARQRLQTIQQHLSASDAEKARHDQAQEDLTKQGQLMHKAETEARLGIDHQKLQLYAQKAQKDSVISPLYARLNKLDSLIEEENKAKDLSLGNLTLDAPTLASEVAGHDANIHQYQNEAAGISQQIDSRIQQTKPSGAARKMATINTSGLPPSGSAVKNPNVPYAPSLPVGGLPPMGSPAPMAPATKPPRGTSIRPLANVPTGQLLANLAQKYAGR
jgi:hypothetical protein